MCNGERESSNVSSKELSLVEQIGIHMRKEYSNGTHVFQRYINSSPALSPSSPNLSNSRFIVHCILQRGSRNKRHGL